MMNNMSVNWKSQEIKVVKDQKHGQNYIDNHSSQNYNVEHF